MDCPFNREAIMSKLQSLWIVAATALIQLEMDEEPHSVDSFLQGAVTDSKVMTDFHLPLLRSTCTRKSNWLQILRLVSQDEPFWKALIEQWIDFASLEIDAHLLSWYRPRMGCAVYLPPAEEQAITSLKQALDALNDHLASNTFLVGHSVTLADIITTCNLYMGFTHLMNKSFTSEFPHVVRYIWTMVNQPNFKQILGEVKQAESVIPITKKPSQPKESAKPKPKLKDEPKKEAKKEEPAKPKPEAGEEEEAPKPKPKNPLDLLPQSSCVGNTS
nr:elongation factor 1-gamma [Quercus suber]